MKWRSRSAGSAWRPFAEACEALPRVVRDLAATGRQRGGTRGARRWKPKWTGRCWTACGRRCCTWSATPPITGSSRRRSGSGRQAAAGQGDRDGGAPGGTGSGVTVSDDGAGLDAGGHPGRLAAARTAGPATTTRNWPGRCSKAGFHPGGGDDDLRPRGGPRQRRGPRSSGSDGSVDVTWVRGRGTTFTLGARRRSPRSAPCSWRWVATCVAIPDHARRATAPRAGPRRSTRRGPRRDHDVDRPGAAGRARASCCPRWRSGRRAGRSP